MIPRFFKEAIAFALLAYCTYYNIPNNALPIFWGNLNGWVPLFERFFNDCDKLEETNSEKFF